MFRKVFSRATKKQFEAAFAQGIQDSLASSAASGRGDPLPEDVEDSGQWPEVHRLADDEPWTVRDDDLAERLGLRSNHEAEARVQKLLKTEEPGLFGRIEFDSESDSFFAYAQVEDDALALKAFLLRMG